MKQETLAWTLRDKLGLTGTKLGCDRGEYDSCTVLIDDVRSLLKHKLRNRKVLMIEGLANADGTLHPPQQGRRRVRISVRVLHARFHQMMSDILRSQLALPPIR